MMNITDVFLYLVGCSINQRAPQEAMLTGMDWAYLLKLAKMHSLVSVVGYAIEKTAVFEQADPEIRKEWREAKEKAVRKTLMLDTERAALISEFEKQKIWYMPLKGIILKDYYPRFGMREMSDNDILFDSQKRMEVKAIFEGRGYKVKGFNHSNHDSYEKAPVLYYEMHVDLFHKETYPDLAAKYQNVREILIKDDNNGYGYHMSNEDYYVFVIAHAYKHYSKGGTGIRTLTDIYVLNHHLGEQLNWDYVNQELASLGVLDYEQNSKTLAEKVFNHPSPLSDTMLSEAEQQMLCYYLGSSTYGNINNRVGHELHSMENAEGNISFQTKVRYIMRRLFPNRDRLGQRYPIVDKCPAIIPFLWIWRIVFKGVKKSSQFMHELKAVQKAK